MHGSFNGYKAMLIQLIFISPQSSACVFAMGVQNAKINT